jgi:hypothetical protein
MEIDLESYWAYQMGERMVKMMALPLGTVMALVKVDELEKQMASLMLSVLSLEMQLEVQSEEHLEKRIQ